MMWKVIFTSSQRSGKKSVWTPEKSRELAIEDYVEALERELLCHDFDTSYQLNLTKDEQTALKNLRGYNDIIN